MLENYVKFLRGTPSQYKALTEKDKERIAKLHLGPFYI